MLTAAILLLATTTAPSPEWAVDAPKVHSYDVIWTSPSKDAAGSMPIGNGEVVLNVWVEAASGDLLFYIARSDALSEISRILKLGQVRVHLDPSPFKNARDFVQHLHLYNGIITLSGGGASIRLFVDSSSNTISVSGSTAKPTRVEVSLDCWRNEPRPLPQAEMGSAWSVHDAPFPLIEAADAFPSEGSDVVTWYHRDETSVIPQLWANQSLTGLKGTFDPIIHRTFGGQISGAGFVKRSPRSLETELPVTSFDVRIATHAAQTATVEDWLAGLKREPAPSQAKTAGGWRQFWDRSWVFADESSNSVTRGYVLQRYVQACQGRGEYPIKFNGGYYTVEPKLMGKPFNADFRNWGDSHWFQNVRHMYHPMLESGDFEMMEPFFRLYEAARPLAESRTKTYHHAKGAYFPETMTVWGTYSGGDYGWDRKGKQPSDVDCMYWRYAWNQGPELVDLMLDYWDYTRDEAFLKKRVLPMAKSVLDYFDTRFHKDADGRIVLDLRSLSRPTGTAS